MPVTITPVSVQQPDIESTLRRIVSDLPGDHSARKLAQLWLSNPQTMQLWLAMFNERAAGFVLVEQARVKAVAVHPATRARGVGRRCVELLKEHYPALGLACGRRERPE